MDVIEGRGPAPSLVLICIAGLPDNSKYHAMLAGGRDNWHDHFGWGQDRYLLADLHDAVRWDSIYTTAWGKNGPTFEPHPSRPTETVTDDSPEPQKRGLRGLWNRFSTGIGG